MRRHPQTQRVRGHRARLLAPLALGLVLATPASPALAADPGDGVPREVEAALGGEVTVTGAGNYRVENEEGQSLTTHGPDFREAVPYPKAAHGTGLGPGDPERMPVCVADPGTGRFQEVLYGYWDPPGAASGTNRLATVRDPIRGAIRRMNAVLAAGSIASGGLAADYVVRCESGEIKVSAFPVATASSTDKATYAEVTAAAAAAGYTNKLADYSIFYDGDGPAGVCGTGSIYQSSSASGLNPNNNPGGSTQGGYAVNYDGCWYGSVPMHENGHNQGAVQPSAPFSTGSGLHCYDENDVMCYSPDGGNVHQEGTINRCTDYLHFDCEWDTYFDAAPEPGEWLETHWNIGSSVNHFVGFGVPGQNTSPSAGFGFDCTDLACDFTDASSDADGTIATRDWDFGDGDASTAENPAHVYAAPGTYAVELTVTDDDGGPTSLTKQVTVPSAPPPANDPFANPEQLTGSATGAIGTNVGATKEPGEPNHGSGNNSGGASVWYRWTAPQSGSVVVDTCGSDFDTLLAVYKSNEDITAQPRIGSNDDAISDGCLVQSEVAFAAQAGTTYRIAVDGYDPTSTTEDDPRTGAIDLALVLTPPPSAPTTPPADPGGSTIPVVPEPAGGDEEDDPIEFPSVALRRGNASSGRAGPRGSVHRYTLQVPRRARNLKVTLDGGPGDLDLYLGTGLNPEKAKFACLPDRPGADESCRVRRPKKGTWYAAVENADASANTAFTIEATYRR